MAQEWRTYICVYIYIYMYIATEHFSTEGKSCTAQDDRPPATKHLCLESLISAKKPHFWQKKSEGFQEKKSKGRLRSPPPHPSLLLSTRTPVFFNRQFIKVCVNKSEKHRLNLSGSQHKGYSQHLQYLDSRKSSAKDLSLPKFEITINHKTFNGRSS